MKHRMRFSNEIMIIPKKWTKSVTDILNFTVNQGKKKGVRANFSSLPMKRTCSVKKN